LLLPQGLAGWLAGAYYFGIALAPESNSKAAWKILLITKALQGLATTHSMHQVSGTKKLQMFV